MSEQCRATIYNSLWIIMYLLYIYISSLLILTEFDEAEIYIFPTLKEIRLVFSWSSEKSVTLISMTFKKRFSSWFCIRRRKTAEAVEAAFIINLLAKLSRVIYTGAVFRVGRSSSYYCWSDSQRVVSQGWCFHPHRHLSIVNSVDCLVPSFSHRRWRLFLFYLCFMIFVKHYQTFRNILLFSIFILIKFTYTYMMHKKIATSKFTTGLPRSLLSFFTTHKSKMR